MNRKVLRLLDDHELALVDDVASLGHAEPDSS